MSELIEVEAIRRLDIKPGEILVVQIPLRSDKEIAAVRDQLTALFPDGTTVIVIGPDVDMRVLAPSQLRLQADVPSKLGGLIADAIRKASENPGKTFEVGE